MNKLNYAQFCYEYCYSHDSESMSEAISTSSPGNSNNLAKSKINRTKVRLLELQNRISEGKKAYQEYLKQFPEEEKNHYQELISIAKGHSDLNSTLAARRILTKKGITWTQ